MRKKKLKYAVHPGEILKVYLDDAGMTTAELAKKTEVEKGFINKIIKKKYDITPEIAKKLEKVFSFDAQFWINLQAIYNEAVLPNGEA